MASAFLFGVCTPILVSAVSTCTSTRTHLHCKLLGFAAAAVQCYYSVTLQATGASIVDSVCDLLLLLLLVLLLLLSTTGSSTRISGMVNLGLLRRCRINTCLNRTATSTVVAPTKNLDQ
jgi:hypothetical protein